MSPERQPPNPPEQPRPSENLGIPFLLSSRFDSRETSQAPYDAIQEIVRSRDVDFSVFRLLQNWPESMSKAPPSAKRWYVVVLGERPPEPLVQQVRDAINMGEPVDIPDQAVAEMVQHRLKEIAKRPYTEIHRSPTIFSRKEHNKAKMKRSMQKQSRRKNRGT